MYVDENPFQDAEEEMVFFLAILSIKEIMMTIVRSFPFAYGYPHATNGIL